MKKLYVFPAIIITLFVNICAQERSLNVPGEKHLTNIKQLTFGGENAEAYFSSDGKQLIVSVEARRPRLRSDLHDEHRRLEREDGFERRRPNDVLVLLQRRKEDSLRFDISRQIKSVRRTPISRKDMSGPIYPDYDIFQANADGSNIKPLTTTPGYDAEATVSPNGKKIVFTSIRDGDLDLYVMDTDGKNVKRLTNELGYDGGAFFSPDNKQIVYRSFHPTTAS